MMKKTVILLMAFCQILTISATEYVYNMVDYNAPSLTTTDGKFELKCSKANGVTPPQAGATDKYGDKDMRYYAGNTLTITNLSGENITEIIFHISRNGHASLTQLAVSTGAMDAEPEYLEPNGYREWEYSWHGDANSVTFTIGDVCIYGYECTENNQVDAGTLFFKALTINTNDASAVNNTTAKPFVAMAQNGTLTINGIVDESPITIFDLTGAKLLTATLQNGTMDICSLRHGIYIVQSTDKIAKIIVR